MTIGLASSRREGRVRKTVLLSEDFPALQVLIKLGETIVLRAASQAARYSHRQQSARL